MVSGKPMRLFKWSPSFTYSQESPMAPVWVNFPDLPLHLFSKGVLYSIASLLGNPVKIDKPTANRSRPSIARVCVEINLLQPSLPQVHIKSGKNVYVQKVFYEDRPHYCHLCSHRGHLPEACFSNGQNKPPPPKPKNQQPAQQQLQPFPEKRKPEGDEFQTRKSKYIIKTHGPPKNTHSQVFSKNPNSPVIQATVRLLEKGESSLQLGFSEKQVTNPIASDTQNKFVILTEDEDSAPFHQKEATTGIISESIPTAAAPCQEKILQKENVSTFEPTHTFIDTNIHSHKPSDNDNMSKALPITFNSSPIVPFSGPIFFGPELNPCRTLILKANHSENIPSPSPSKLNASQPSPPQPNPSPIPSQTNPPPEAFLSPSLTPTQISLLKGPPIGPSPNHQAHPTPQADSSNKKLLCLLNRQCPIPADLDLHEVKESLNVARSLSFEEDSSSVSTTSDIQVEEVVLSKKKAKGKGQATVARSTRSTAKSKNTTGFSSRH